MTEQARFHSGNRTALRSLPDAPEIIVIAGAGPVQSRGDQIYPFVQESSFYYLTGVSEPNAVLVIDGETEYLMLPKRSAVKVAFEGDVDHAALQAQSGIAEIITTDEGWKRLRQRGTASEVGVLAPNDVFIEAYEMYAAPTRRYIQDKVQESMPETERIDLRKVLMNMRVAKQPYEISMIKKAIDHTAQLFEVIEHVRTSARTEQELHAEVMKQTVLGRHRHAYEPIIASGINACTLHYVANNAALDKKGLLLLDIGLEHMGYAADITRTVARKPTKRQEEVYNAVLAVQEFAIGQLKAGVTLRDYERQVADCMGEQLRELKLIKNGDETRRYYPHATSHFLGLDVHDVGDGYQPLPEQAVVTVEPGIYIPEENIGIRIEDDVVVGKNGVEVLTKQLPHNLRSLTIPV